MNKEVMIRTFNYVQFQLEHAGSMVKRTNHGARLGYIRLYIKLFGEYIRLKKKLRDVIGGKAVAKMDKVHTLERTYVFDQLNTLEQNAWEDLYELMD